ncbi:hypothetical protein ABT300_18820 [Streptomyces sp. NPDC001027]|uniref:hypothetical protein n=1 Tax=Streptomyces sp. NPDC001027 TaxID=3154771 RepID=UPI003333321E
METQDLIQGINNGDFFLLAQEERELILPWLRNTITTQGEDPKGLLLQALTNILESGDYKRIHNRNLLLLNRQEAESFLPWLWETLTTQQREDDNSDLCQTFSRVLNTANQVYGTGPFNRATCICNG